MLSLEAPPVGFWIAWLLTFLGFPLGGGLAHLLVKSVDNVTRAAMGGAVTGVVIGAAQWLVLRGAVAVSGGWIAASSLGLAAGLALSVALIGAGTGYRDLALRGALTGIVVATVQWLVLRHHVMGAGVWVAAVTMAWALGWTATKAAGVDLSRGWTVFGASGAIVFTVLTGLALRWMLREPFPRP